MSRSTIVFAAFVSCLSISTGIAEEPQSASNAALRYWQAFAVMPQLDEQEARHFGGTPGGEYPPNYFGAPLNDIAVGLIRRSDTALMLLHRGAKQPDCAWGVDLDDGPHALLPHTSKARHLAGLACLRAKYRFERGQHAAGVDDVMAVLTLARQVGADRTLVGLYVQWATEKQAIDIAAAHLPKLERAALEQLATQFDGLPQGGSLQRTLQVEKDYLLGWYIKQLRSNQAGTSIENIFGPDVQTLEVAKSVAAPLEKMAEMLEAIRPFYDELGQLADLPPDERSSRLASVQQKAQEASPLAQLFIPGYRITFENEPQARTRVAMFKAAIDIVRGGADKVATHTDPYGGAIAYRPLGTAGAFELSSQLQVKGSRFRMKFGEPTFTWGVPAPGQ